VRNSVPRSALVTGASSGVGLAITKKFLKEGYQVIGLARNFSKPDVVGLRKQSQCFDQVVCDLADVDSLPDKLASLPAAVDRLVLNAGYGRFGGIEQFSHQQIRHLIDTNLVSNLFLIKHFLPAMKKQGGGDIVLIGSESALQGARAGAVYCASKFALRGLAQSLRADCSTSNIRVILVNPGPVDTDFFDELSFEPRAGEEFIIDPQAVALAVDQALRQPPNVVVEEINLQPMKRSFSKK